MRIGILTIPLNINYGGVLQAYALQTVLERMGHEVKVIHTVPHLKEPNIWEYLYRYYQKKVLGRKLFVKKEKWHNQVDSIVRRNTDAFIERHIHCYTVSSLREIKESDFDAFVVGSDQIWRQKYFVESWGDDETNAFLGFAEEWDIQRLAYAPSFGTDEWEFSENYSSDISRLIKKFNAVSVREKSGVELCKKYLNVKALHLLDPTMLLDEDDYNSFVDGFQTSCEDNSLFCYILDDSKEKQELIHSVASAKNLIPCQMNLSVSSIYTDISRCRPVPSLEYFLLGIQNAKFVVTDSFHGCVFSILFRKPFVAIANTQRGSSRMESLLQMFGLENHLISDISEYRSENSYEISDDVRIAIESHKRNSLEYLKHNFPCQLKENNK